MQLNTKFPKLMKGVRQLLSESGKYDFLCPLYRCTLFSIYLTTAVAVTQIMQIVSCQVTSSYPHQ